MLGSSNVTDGQGVVSEVGTAGRAPGNGLSGGVLSPGQGVTHGNL